MSTATTIPGQKENKNTLTSAVIVIVVGVLATTLSQPQLLGRIPIQNLLKNELHVDRAANAAFFFWIGLAWYFKPIAGLITDAFPLFGSRRKSYILISTIMATLSWVGLYFTPHVYNKFLWVCIVIDVFMVIASTVVGAYMVETAQANSGSGRLVSVRLFVQQACYIVMGPTAGFLGSIAFGWTAAACGGVMFLLAPAAVFFLHEQRKRIDARELFDNAGKQLVTIGHAKTMWAASGLMALFYIAPGLATASFYKEQNDLHLNTQGQGFLQLIFGVLGVVAAMAYGYLCKRINLRNLLLGSLLISTLSTLTFMIYTTVPRAQFVQGAYGFGYTLAEVALMDLAVRATPVGSEGLGFSLMMSVRNFMLFGSDWFGSVLMDRHNVSFTALVLMNAVTTLIAVPLVLVLPRILVSRKDAEAPDELPALKTAIQE